MKLLKSLVAVAALSLVMVGTAWLIVKKSFCYRHGCKYRMWLRTMR